MENTINITTDNHTAARTTVFVRFGKSRDFSQPLVGCEELIFAGHISRADAISSTIRELNSMRKKAGCHAHLSREFSHLTIRHLSVVNGRLTASNVAEVVIQ